MSIEVIREMVAEEVSITVRIWMYWMMFIFFTSLVFVAKFKPARWIFTSIIATAVLAIITWKITENIHLFGIPHIIVWTPLAVYLWKSTLSPSARLASQTIGAYSKAHFIWVTLLFVTIIISLVFDVRDFYLVMIGAK